MINLAKGACIIFTATHTRDLLKQMGYGKNAGSNEPGKLGNVSLALD